MHQAIVLLLLLGAFIAVMYLVPWLGDAPIGTVRSKVGWVIFVVVLAALVIIGLKSEKYPGK
jgi:hypothetical protein